MESGFNIQMSQEGREMFLTIAKMGKKLNLKQGFFLIGIAYRKEVKAIFERQQRRPNVEPWKALSSDYAVARQRKYGRRPLLNVTGRLKRSMTDKSHSENIEILDALKGTYGTRVKYGVFHDKGTRKMPRRNFTIPSTSSYGTYRKIFEGEVARQLALGGIKV